MKNILLSLCLFTAMAPAGAPSDAELDSTLQFLRDAQAKLSNRSSSIVEDLQISICTRIFEEIDHLLTNTKALLIEKKILEELHKEIRMPYVYPGRRIDPTQIQSMITKSLAEVDSLEQNATPQVRTQIQAIKSSHQRRIEERLIEIHEIYKAFQTP